MAATGPNVFELSLQPAGRLRKFDSQETVDQNKHLVLAMGKFLWGSDFVQNMSDLNLLLTENQGSRPETIKKIHLVARDSYTLPQVGREGG